MKIVITSCEHGCFGLSVNEIGMDERCQEMHVHVCEDELETLRRLSCASASLAWVRGFVLAGLYLRMEGARRLSK